MSNYYNDLLSQIKRVSYNLVTSTGIALKYHDGLFLSTPETLDHIQLFNDFISRHDYLKSISDFKNSNQEILIVPTIQMGLYGITQDQQFLEKIPSLNPSSITVSSPYLNFESKLLNILLTTKLSVITSSPESNGFFNSSGVSRYLPAAYTYLETRFLQDAILFKKFLIVSEYFRENWTFHGKGMFISCKDYDITSIGSSNFGYRSMNRDLESNVYIFSKCKDLNTRIKHVHDKSITLYSKQISLSDLKGVSRRPHWLTKLATRLIKTML